MADTFKSLADENYRIPHYQRDMLNAIDLLLHFIDEGYQRVFGERYDDKNVAEAKIQAEHLAAWQSLEKSARDMKARLELEMNRVRKVK